MAEVIGVASGLVALISFALQSSVALFETLSSFKSRTNGTRGLEEGLETLTATLRSLTGYMEGSTEVYLSALRLPLLRCGSACEEFKSELLRLSALSRDDQPNFRDWAKLQYMGEDINGFREMLASYTSTFAIALTDAQL
jgi:hypothetical protein